MTYYIKLQVECKEEIDVPELTNQLFTKLKEADLQVTAVGISNGQNPPTAEDELILEKGLQDEPAESEGGNTTKTAITEPQVEQSVEPPAPIEDPDDFQPTKVIYTQKPSSITDDPEKHTWNFGTKWI